MNFVKRLTGTLLTVGVMLGSFGVNCSVVYARDASNGDPSKYCEPELVAQLFGTADETMVIMNEYWNKGLIGYINSDGSRGNGTNNLSQVKYWITGKQCNDFWTSSAYYLFSYDPSDARIYHNWQHGDYFSETDNNGDDNYVEINGAYYLRSINRDDMLDVINGMNVVLDPIRRVLGAEPTNAKTDEKGPSHTHNFVETTVREATADSDEIIAMECSICGQQASHVTVDGSAVSQFVRDTIAKLENASADASVAIDTKIWTCFNRPVIEALKSRQDVTTTVNFRYKGVEYTFTIPAGYGAEKLDALLDENGYCGFMYLVSVFGGQEVVK